MQLNTLFLSLGSCHIKKYPKCKDQKLYKFNKGNTYSSSKLYTRDLWAVYVKHIWVSSYLKLIWQINQLNIKIILMLQYLWTLAIYSWKWNFDAVIKYLISFFYSPLNHCVLRLAFKMRFIWHIIINCINM